MQRAPQAIPLARELVEAAQLRVNFTQALLDGLRHIA
jgi:hypothetical protein